MHVDYHLLNTEFISHRPQNELCLCTDLINQHCVNIFVPCVLINTKCII